jgi:hypothetical protein
MHLPNLSTERRRNNYKQCGQGSQLEGQHFKGHMTIINFIDKSDASLSGAEHYSTLIVGLLLIEVTDMHCGHNYRGFSEM